MVKMEDMVVACGDARCVVVSEDYGRCGSCK